jgi:hypothetical protein
MTILGKLVVREATRALRRAQERRIRALERELTQFSTAADRADLSATLDRYPDHHTDEIRTILQRQSSAASQPAGHLRPPHHSTYLLKYRAGGFRT